MSQLEMEYTPCYSSNFRDLEGIPAAELDINPNGSGMDQQSNNYHHQTVNAPADQLFTEPQQSYANRTPTTQSPETSASWLQAVGQLQSPAPAENVPTSVHQCVGQFQSPNQLSMACFNGSQAVEQWQQEASTDQITLTNLSENSKSGADLMNERNPKADIQYQARVHDGPVAVGSQNPQLAYFWPADVDQPSSIQPSTMVANGLPLTGARSDFGYVSGPKSVVSRKSVSSVRSEQLRKNQREKERRQQHRIEVDRLRAILPDGTGKSETELIKLSASFIRQLVMENSQLKERNERLLSIFDGN